VLACPSKLRMELEAGATEETLRELGGLASLVPVLPGFEKAAVLYADYRGAGDVHLARRRDVPQFCGPVETDEIAFGERNHGSDADVRVFGADGVAEAAKVFGAANIVLAVVHDGIGGKEFGDGFIAVLVPDLFEPADDEMFVLFLGRCGLRG